MRTRRLEGIPWILAIIIVSLLVGFAASSSVAQLLMPSGEPDNPPALPGQEQPEVLNRGPVHEAFAEPINLQAQSGLIAPERPPPNIVELPPEQRPLGLQYAWIPGYWSWDADRRGYIWVSACWRVAPPRMSWVPGYWAQVSGGWEWVAGFWTPAGVQEIEYLPVPPTVGDLEPYGPQPSADTIWVPPCMYWVQGRYVRRSGYWLAAQSDWVWVPAHYIMTPRGYVFAAGHWDYALERRGVLFAPVYFPSGAYRRAAFTFSPRIVIDIGLLRFSLFAYPRYSHYYFGDYYDDAYLNIGIFPWFDSHRRHTWYDPVYEHARWRHRRSEPRWEEQRREEYNRRRADTNLRPARTYREQESRVAKLPEAQRRAVQVTRPIDSLASRHESPMKFERLTTAKRQEVQKQAAAVHTFGNERNRWESPSASQQKTPSPDSERRERVVQRIPERRETLQPTKEERKAVVTPPGVEHRESVHPSMDRKGVVVPPAIEHRETVQPRDHKVTVTPPVIQRESVVAPPRESRSREPERVRIPTPPIVGQSGRSGIFQRGPPSQPSDEGKGNAGNDFRKGRGSSR